MKRRMLAALLAAVIFGLAFSGCGQMDASSVTGGSREFTDSLGRTVTLPEKVTKIAPSGTLAQVYLYPLCADMFVGSCSKFSDEAKKYIPEEFFEKPEIGQLYDLSAELDLEMLLRLSPDVIIDLGESKANMAEELDQLTAQTGIPFVHIDATVATAPSAYRKLGELLGREEQAEALAKWCEDTYSDVESMMARIDGDGARLSLVYCLDYQGSMNVLTRGTFHSDTIDMLSNNIAELENANRSSAGTPVDMEQLMLWNPDVIVFAANSFYDEAVSSQAWQQLDAVKNARVYETPFGPYGWLSSPPSVQRYLGMLWLGEVLYPEYTDYDLQEKVTEYYKLFYDYTLTDADYHELTKNSIG